MRLDVRRRWLWLPILVLLAVGVVLLRRWVHHAQLESVSVIVPDDVAAADVVHPPAGTIARRMLRDVAETFAPPTRPRFAVLTFDDGPFPVTTPLLLAQLQALHVPADFFLIGEDARQQPALAQSIAAGDVELGNHTLTHPEMPGHSLFEQQAEIAGGTLAIARVTGRQTQYFRPPHGNYDALTIRAARAQRQTVALWDVDPGDWRSITPQAIIDNVEARARAPAVILLHNGKLATVQALPAIVSAYRAAGYRFVTLSELQRQVSLDEINDPAKVKL